MLHFLNWWCSLYNNSYKISTLPLVKKEKGITDNITIGWNEENIGKKENHSAALKWPNRKRHQGKPPKGSLVFPK